MGDDLDRFKIRLASFPESDAVSLVLTKRGQTVDLNTSTVAIIDEWRRSADRIEALEALVRALAAEQPGGEVWQRSKRFAEYSERARQTLGEGQ